jgi:hypothetical protein
MEKKLIDDVSSSMFIKSYYRLSAGTVVVVQDRWVRRGRRKETNLCVPCCHTHTVILHWPAGTLAVAIGQREEEDERDACKDKQLEGMCWACGPRLRCPLACYFCGLLVRLFVLLWL